jgi:hypothetical protein
MCSDIVRPSQPYMTIDLINVLYIFSLVIFYISRDCKTNRRVCALHKLSAATQLGAVVNVIHVFPWKSSKPQGHGAIWARVVSVYNQADQAQQYKIYLEMFSGHTERFTASYAPSD